MPFTTFRNNGGVGRKIATKFFPANTAQATIVAGIWLPTNANNACPNFAPIATRFIPASIPKHRSAKDVTRLRNCSFTIVLFAIIQCAVTVVRFSPVSFAGNSSVSTAEMAVL
mmetsp:Transcript_10414/g.22132  ORF Transcript_10414/g.22132 Transcript_10414/m.22132 type:complete len:113 (+) Transcript_10414:988-1326(+)